MPYARAVWQNHDDALTLELKAIAQAHEYREELRTKKPDSLYTRDKIVHLIKMQEDKIRAAFFNLTSCESLADDYELHRELGLQILAKQDAAFKHADEFRNRLLSHMFRPTARNRENLHKFVQILYKARRKSRRAGDLANVQDIDRKIAVYTAIARECIQVIRIAVGRVQADATLYTPEGKSKSSYNLVIHNAQGSAATTRKEKAKVRVGLARKPKPLAEEFDTWAELKKETTEKTGRAINRLPLRIASASTRRV